MSNQFLIYGLIDPDTQQLRYVGKSSRGLYEPRSHWTHRSKREQQNHCHCWIRSVLTRGQAPEIVVIEELQSRDQLNDAETHHVAYFKFIGCDLTNMTKGGDGWSGPVPDEVKAKISATRRERCYVSWTKIHGHSAETRKKISEAGMGRKHSPETRARMSASQIRRWKRGENAI